VSPWRLCSEPGCRLAAIPGGRCVGHGRARKRAADARRPSAYERGYTSATWRRQRAATLKRDPICSESGCGQPSTDADHIVPREQGGSDALENLVGLCHAHHSAKTAGRDGAFGNPQR